MLFHNACRSAVFITSLAFTHASAQNLADLRVVAITGEPASAVLAGLNNGWFRLSATERSQIDNNGNIVYWLGLGGSGITQYNGVCLMHLPAGMDARNGEAQLILRQGTQALGAQFGSQYHEVRSMALSPEGRLALNMYRRGAAGQSTVNGYSNYIWSVSGMSLLAGTAGEVPGDVPPLHYLQLKHPQQSGTDEAAVWISVIEESGATQAQLFSDEQHTLLARAGTQVPGQPAGVTFDEIESVAYSGGSNAYVLASVTGTGISSSNDFGIWLTDGSAATELLRKGGPVPGLPTNLYCDSADIIPSAGGFHALKIYFSGPGTNVYNDDALYVLAEGTEPTLILRDGQLVPGYESGAAFTTVRYALVNKHAEAMFIVTTYGSSLTHPGSGLWKASNTHDITPILITGDHAPGHAPGVQISGVLQFDMNSSGDFAVSTTLQGPDIDFTNNRQIYIGTHDGQFFRAVQTGQMVDVSKSGEPSDLRQVDKLSFEFLEHFNSRIQYSQLNENRELALNARFTDGTTAVIVASPPPPCLADVNGDGMVTPTDFTAWVSAFNSNAPECDQNGDGMCTPTDFSAWVGNYNAGC